MARTQQPDTKPKLTAEALKIWRVAKAVSDPPNWTQEYVADWLGVYSRTYRRWENGEQKIPLWVAKRILEYETMRRALNPPVLPPPFP
jgi:hypothetical protein